MILRRLYFALPALAVAWVFLAPAAPAATDTTHRLFVDGDSLAVGTKPYLPRMLPGWKIRTSAVISRHAAQGPGVLRAVGELPPVVAVSLGTNDDPGRPDLFKSAIESTLKVVGPDRCVVWANIVRPAVGGVSYTALNRTLRQEAQAHPNLLVVDWVKLSKKHRKWFAPGHVHVNATGYRARAKLFAAAIRRCPSPEQA
jgi:hypothetical protein